MSPPWRPFFVPTLVCLFHPEGGGEERMDNDRNTKIGEIASMVCQMNDEQLKNVHVYTEDELKEPNHEAVALDAVIQISKKYGRNQRKEEG